MLLHFNILSDLHLTPMTSPEHYLIIKTYGVSSKVSEPEKELSCLKNETKPTRKQYFGAGLKFELKKSNPAFAGFVK